MPIPAQHEITTLSISDSSQPTWNDLLGIFDGLILNVTDSLTPDELQTVRKQYMVFDDSLYKRNGTSLLNVDYETNIVQRASVFHVQTGHSSAATVLRLLKKEVYHPTLIFCVQDVRLCPQCSMRVPQATIGLTIDPIPQTIPFHRWGLDYVGPITFDNERFYLLDAIDYANSWPLSFLTYAADSLTVSKMLTHIISTYGMPIKIISDNGAQFVSHEFQSFLQLHKINHATTTPYYP